MLTVTLLPNYRKLKHYYPDVTEEQIKSVEANGGVESYLEHQTEESFESISESLKTICSKHGVDEHYNELLFLLMLKNEQIRERYETYWQNYYDDLTSKEVAQFLLTYKETKPNVHFSLVAKSATKGSASIKDTFIAKWMAEQLYKRIEQREFPLGLFGEKLLFDLFGNDFNSDRPIDIDRLKATASRSPRKPTVRFKRLFTELCLFIQPFLDEQTQLKRLDGATLSDAQANFFFDLLETLGFVNADEIESEPKDYIYAIFNNYHR